MFGGEKGPAARGRSLDPGVKGKPLVSGQFGPLGVLPEHQGGPTQPRRMLAEHERHRRRPSMFITPEG